ncbi:NKG2-E type II integral membrane protein-like [Mugil cephalus]|uniref:NKG2-E type II integral membrane protein-like n=1 Tax=Mugil cephalus TaxID=48193 RepID=UPI001FB5D973|nr:NKG2-E type II integral membrane protein-like [Mugil cephalus]
MYCELMENDEERNRRPDVGRRAFLDVLRPCRPRSRHVVAFVLGVLCLVLLIALIAVAVRLTSGPEVMKLTQPPFVSCPPEWYRFHNSCYILSDDPRDWLSSKSYCESKELTWPSSSRPRSRGFCGSFFLTPGGGRTGSDSATTGRRVGGSGPTARRWAQISG